MFALKFNLSKLSNDTIELIFYFKAQITINKNAKERVRRKKGGGGARKRGDGALVVTISSIRTVVILVFRSKNIYDNRAVYTKILFFASPRGQT